MLQRSPSWAWTQRREAGISYVKVDTGSISRHTNLVSALTGTCAALCFSLLPSHVPDHPAAYMIHVGSSAQLRLLYTAAAVSLTIVGATINTLGWDSIVLPTAPLPDDCVVHWSKCTATWYQVPLNMCYLILPSPPWSWLNTLVLHAMNPNVWNVATFVAHT